MTDVENCSICFEELNGEKEEYKLSCDHNYHKDCISLWLSNHTTCPLCRANVDPIDQYVEDEIVTPERLTDIRAEVERLRNLTELGAYGLESIGMLVFPKSKGLGNYIGSCARQGLFDDSLEKIARKQPGAWWSFGIMAILFAIVHFSTRDSD